MSRIVVAVGGNALSAQAELQEEQFRKVAHILLPAMLSGDELILVHGNGPQVGLFHHVFEMAAEDGIGSALPFCDCTAMNEGCMGYHLEQAIDCELKDAGRTDIPVTTLITRVVVDPNDPAFVDPEKPVGRFYTKKEAEERMRVTGNKYGEDSGRGWRRMVPSPAPQHIVEAPIMQKLAGSGCIVIGGGGAGIPVVADGKGSYQGVSAVCDKDLTGSKIAQLIDADMLVLLTAVDNVVLNFGKPDAKALTEMTPEQAEQYIKEGQFPPGSMLPKVEACVQFVGDSKERVAMIGNLKNAAAVLAQKSGTRIRNASAS